MGNMSTGTAIVNPCIHQQLYQISTLGGPMTKQLFCGLIFDVLPRHINIMTDKGFNLLNERAARCVHLSPQEVHLYFLRGQ